MTSNELEIFKQSILDDVRVMMQTTGQVTQYIGARYVPLFAEPLDWSNTREYEPLTIVLHQGNSFTSRQFVPSGVDISNTEFWANTGNYNAQIEQYRREVEAVKEALHSEITNRYYATPEEYGAKGDGITDDTLAIQAMLESGKNVFEFGRNKIYATHGGLKFSGSKVFHGNGSTLKNIKLDANTFTDDTAYLLTNLDKNNIEDNTDIIIENLTFCGEFSNSININNRISTDFPFEYGTLLSFNSGNSVTINNCSFIDSLQDGIHCNGVKNVKVTNSYFEQIGCTFINSYNYGGSNNAITFYHYKLTPSGQTKVRLNSFKFINNRINVVRDEAIRLDQTAYSVISGNTVYECMQHFIEHFKIDTEDERIICCNNIIDYIGGRMFTVQTNTNAKLDIVIDNNIVTNAGLTNSSYDENRGGFAIFGITEDTVTNNITITNNIVECYSYVPYIVFMNTGALTFANNTLTYKAKQSTIYCPNGNVNIINNIFNNDNEQNDESIHFEINKTFKFTGNVVNFTTNKGRIIRTSGLEYGIIQGNKFNGGNYVVYNEETTVNSCLIVSENIAIDTPNFIYAESVMRAAILTNNISTGALGTFNSGAIGNGAINAENKFNG